MHFYLGPEESEGCETLVHRVNIDSPRFVCGVFESLKSKSKVFPVIRIRKGWLCEGFSACEFSGRTFEWLGTIMRLQRAEISHVKPDRK